MKSSQKHAIQQGVAMFISVAKTIWYQILGHAMNSQLEKGYGRKQDLICDIIQDISWMD
jgi:hypothetical protein